MSLARRNLFQDKTRLALSIGGVALAVMLILVLKGFLAGMNRQITSYLDQSPGTIVVAQEDVVNLLGSTSLLPDGHEIMRLLRRIAKEQGRSVVIVSHDQRIKDIADRVLWLEDGEFKETVTMMIDPVCRMSVEREKAISAEWEGQLFYFCARGCRDEFLGNPDDFLPAINIRSFQEQSIK